MVDVMVPGDPLSLELLRRMVEEEGGTLQYEPPEERRSALGDWAYLASTNIPAQILGITTGAATVLVQRHRERLETLRAERLGRHSRSDEEPRSSE